MKNCPYCYSSVLTKVDETDTLPERVLCDTCGCCLPVEMWETAHRMAFGLLQQKSNDLPLDKTVPWPYGVIVQVLDRAKPNPYRAIGEEEAVDRYIVFDPHGGRDLDTLTGHWTTWYRHKENAQVRVCSSIWLAMKDAGYL